MLYNLAMLRPVLLAIVMGSLLGMGAAHSLGSACGQSCRGASAESLWATSAPSGTTPSRLSHLRLRAGIRLSDRTIHGDRSPYMAVPVLRDLRGVRSAL